MWDTEVIELHCVGRMISRVVGEVMFFMIDVEYNFVVVVGSVIAGVAS